MTKQALQALHDHAQHFAALHRTGDLQKLPCEARGKLLGLAAQTMHLESLHDDDHKVMDSIAHLIEQRELPSSEAQDIVSKMAFLKVAISISKLVRTDAWKEASSELAYAFLCMTEAEDSIDDDIRADHSARIAEVVG